MLREADTIEDFLADPLGRYVAGRTFVAWVCSPKLAGASHFGRIELEDHAPILATFELHRNPALEPPFRVLLDVGGIEDVDARSYGLLAQYMARWSEVAPRLERLAIVRPPGMANAISAGVFHETIRPGTQAELFDRRADALAWLEVSGDDAAAIDGALAGATEPAMLRLLRHHLAGDLRNASLESAARALATSARTLQRALAGLRTSFRAELDRVRVATAQRLLLDGDLKVEAIAREIGCKSPSAFYDLFRRHVGDSPQSFRDRHRR